MKRQDADKSNIKKQKFKKGDLVHITENMPSYMSHFTSDIDAVVIGSYADQFGGSDVKSYTLLLIKDGKWYNESSWYKEEQLTFIAYKGEEYIKQLRDEKEQYDKKVERLDYIVSHWLEMKIDGVPHASAVTLMKLVGITEPWGLHGEYWDFYQHWTITRKLLDPILSTGDIAKVKEFLGSIEKVDSYLLSNDLYHGDSKKREIPESWMRK